MSDDKGAVEEENEKIRAIVGEEVLGYQGGGREEHSGQNSPAETQSMEETLADNDPDQVR